MRDIPIHAGKNMELADWLLQIEKVALPKLSRIWTSDSLNLKALLKKCWKE